MPRNDQPDRTQVTFSQAERLEPLPQPLALGELSQEFRSLLWREVYESLNAYRYRDDYTGGDDLQDSWRKILYDKHVEVDHLPADEFGSWFDGNARIVKSLIMEQGWNKVFDFLQFVMRHPGCPPGFFDGVCQALKAGRAAYTVILDGPTIIPQATPEEGAAIAEAFALAGETGLDGARTHLRDAAEAMNRGDYAGSVQESIHAVESVARHLNADASKTLEPALRALEERIKLHPALKQGFSKIYGYTSDEDGIRHALLEGDAADVDITDATFMLGACASFVTYLINKARGSGLIEGG